MPPAEEVEARVPGDEVVSAPRDGEVVVFAEHFSHGFSLPASVFFKRFLTHFGLQPHHLGPNSILQIATFVTFSEGYVGLLPTPELWSRFFSLWPQTVNGIMTACGAALVYNRPVGGFPKLPPIESAKKWQRSFFYMKNASQSADRINLPPFVDTPPTAKQNWSFNLKRSTVEAIAISGRLDEMLKQEHLVATDFIAAFINRRVQPLQHRPHRICDMSDRLDPCRLSTIELTPAQLARRVNNITVAKLDETTWFFGKEPYCRAAPAPAVSFQPAPFSISFAFFCFNPRRPRLQRFLSQQMHDGPHPRNLMADWLVSDGEDEEGDEAGEGDAEHLEGADDDADDLMPFA